MTAGLLGGPLPEQPPSSAFAVNEFAPGTVAARLAGLAPLHQRAALRRASLPADTDGQFPTLDEIHTAERPPVHLWQVLDASGRVPVIAGVNDEEYECGRSLAARFRPLLASAREVLDGLDDAVPRSALAATPDPDLCKIAADRATAAHQRWVIMAGVAVAMGKVPEELTPDLRRTHCPLWQRRQVRKQSGEARQHLAAALGTVGRGGAPYADDYSVARWNERQAAQVRWATERVLAGPDGTRVPMKEVVASGQAAQQARMYAMMLGVDEIARRRALIAVFVTVTLPPEWHPGPAEGHRTWTLDRTPAMADDALRGVWARFRALLADRGVPTLGLRVWEPHRDGCPHMHALLYVTPDQVTTVDDALMTVCPEPHPGRRIASKIEIIDRGRASPASYVMKYILKAISAVPGDGERAPGKGEGDNDDDQLQHYERHRAVASERGWRRYGWLGVHGVQRVWQRLLTTKELPADASNSVQAAWAALHSGRWADALEFLGAIGPRGEGVRLGYEETETRYGDIARRAVRVVDLASGWTMPLTREGWTVKGVEGATPLTVVMSCPRSKDSTNADEDDDNEFCCTLSTRRAFLAGTGPPDPAGLTIHPLAA